MIISEKLTLKKLTMLTQDTKLKTRVLALALVCSFFLVSCGDQPPPPQEIPVLSISQSDTTNLMLALEDDFALQEVLVSQSGTTVTVRFKAPTISNEELYSGLTQIFAYINEQLPADIQTIELVFVLNHVDSATLSIDRNSIRDWKESKMSNTDFINKIKKTSLL